MTAPTTARPALSPCCGKPLEGGPVICWCTGCGHDVHASTIDREFHGPVDCAYLHGNFSAGCPWCTPRRSS